MRTTDRRLDAVLSSASALLAPIAPVSVRTARLVRRVRGRRPLRLPIPVISVGNLAVGGTGKTPTVARLVELLSDMGHRVGVVMGAYRARPPYQDTADGTTRWALVCDGDALLADVETAGDEAVMFALDHPTVPLAVGRRKASVARELALNFELDCLVIDDGFQHVRLARDLDIVLLDSRRPLLDGRVLPAGRLREPPDALRYAHVIGATRVRNAQDMDAVRAVAATHAPSALVAEVHHHPSGIREYPAGDVLGDPMDSRRELGSLQGVEVVAACGIGTPSAFEDTLRGLGARVRLLPFPDHHAYTSRDWDEIRLFARNAPIVTTAKDSVKWIGNVPWPFWVLDIRVEFRPEAVIRGALDAAIAGHSHGTEE